METIRDAARLGDLVGPLAGLGEVAAAEAPAVRVIFVE